MVLSSRSMALAVVLLLVGPQARAAEGQGGYPDASIPEFPQTSVSASPAPKAPGVTVQSSRRARTAPAPVVRPAVAESVEVETGEVAEFVEPVVRQTSAVTSTPVAPAIMSSPNFGPSTPAQPTSTAVRMQSGCPTCAPAAAPARAHTHHTRHSDGGEHAPGPIERLKWKYNNYWKPGLQEKFWGYPEEFGEKPLGYWVYAHARTQTANGEAARMVLYSMDFAERSDALTPRGQLQLGRIAYMAPQNFFPIIIESTPAEPELAEKRRMKVLEILQASNIPVPAERVVVSRAVAAPMGSYQTEAAQGNLNQIIDTGGIVDPASLIRTEIQEVGN